MNLKNDPENPERWTLPIDLPSAFALPQEFRQSLPDEAQEWLASAFDRVASRDLRTAELALLLLAAGPRSLDLLGIEARNTEAIRHG